ncbi:MULTISPECIES: glycogen/starch/alpha-glucan phosphorylase [unclassified Pseudomonas]|uniref:glycogen/starch/alpha-glucan phosphorylase n=1 Tax=unclassified Pseudomonas TaxID=196821 RepID=UPI0024494097|nr:MULTISPECIES: glycogen/starch/alpha-glucan phosphorylase [unclassified Pseudomonas]MDG9927293.1 glycogen/starch/alpha-glucan phosphorylase [Pseudomonas sp. GD04042]MDH0482362.1 glycogen/starch/alpha-glucan phosphorylase [Pseudomonas sp. GD04015]MDH0602714.1 glycogen/starch/alpha-glucan phosphorylase [Pseudomonas sp. GD03869]MDH0897454.1 glycogen/starch/alpha-glucan phosphorylase [Pseudomonas sp. GD03875]MDH1067603.1 glycogen/starch/alpha-glucan phosphorylase [Pseudomonas sp. GD03985]
MAEQERAAEADVAGFRQSILAKLKYAVGKDPSNAYDHDWFEAVALAARDHVIDRWEEASVELDRRAQKRVYYLSLEFLIGRLLIDNLSNLGLLETAREALAELGVDLERIRQVEPDAALGNGGLGRLAACFMESMATLGLAAHGYGIRYEHGLFRQVIADGFQLEQTESWLDFGNPWEFERPEIAYSVGFGGSVLSQVDDGDVPRQVWQPMETIRAIAYDTPVVGWRRSAVNSLRLWRSRAEEDLHLERFNAGDHLGAVEDVVRAESISRVLYPADSTEAGQELRLRQEYFFVSASLQDLLQRHLREQGDVASLPRHAAIQLNDTHPAIAVAELMRLLVDVHQLPWYDAWQATVATLSYTNHTLLPEALESWPVSLMERLLPRHMQIIYLINAYHIDSLRAQDIHDFALLRSVSLIEEDHGRRVRMGNLAFLGAHSVNGVSALHTELMRKTVFRDLHGLYPTRINNKTNGVTFRRWLFQVNPGLTGLLVETLGAEVLDSPEQVLQELEAHADKKAMHRRFAELRQHNKAALAALVQERLGVVLDTSALFDVQVKRIHEYKRQLLNLLHTVALYQAIRNDPATEWTPRVKIFAGKAAASYHQAKLIIKLANDISRVVNDDPTVRGRLKVVFIPNYNVSLAETIIPAADLSEQISTAGLEASGTSNMKFGLNGALTIGTLDGANVEMRERVGGENMFIFGMTAQQVEERKRAGELNMASVIASSPRLEAALEAIRAGVFSPDDPARYVGLVDALVYDDRFMVCPDFDDYWLAQRRVDELWRSPARWWRAAVLNTARMGWFSSDRTIREYARDIWGAMPR